MKTAVTALTGSLALAASLGVCSIAYGATPFDGSTDFESISLTDSLFDGDIDESAIVTDATVTNAASRPTNYKFASNRDKVLSVETSGTLWRYLDSSSNAVSTASDTIFADMLVKCENVVTDNAPTPSTGDQLLVYFKDNSGTTNLCVVAYADIVEGEINQYHEDGIEFALATPAAVGAIAGGNWYRLVIEALNDVTPGDKNPDPGFKIYLGGYGDDYLCTSGSADAFQSLTATDSGDGAITSIGFRGNGSVDDLVLSTNDPSKAAPMVISIAWDSAGLSDVAYSIDGGAAVALVNDGAEDIEVPAGSAITLVGTTTAGLTVTATGDTTTPPALSTQAIDWYFPQTATAGQDGTAAHPFEIAVPGDLIALKDAVANVAAARSLCYVQTANIDMSSAGAFAGIGTYNATPTAGTPFTGTYDGGNYKIMNVDFTQRNYGGVFNQVNGGTIKNLTVSNITCSAFSSSVNDGEWGGAIVGNAGNGATLQNLVAEGTFAADHVATHNVAGIVIRACAGGTGTLIKDCTNNATLYGAYTKIGGICAIIQHKIDGGVVTFDGCVNNGDIISSRTTTGVTGFAGILGYVDDSAVLVNCSNTGSIVNNSGANTDKDGALVGWSYGSGRTLTDNGGNSAPANVKMIGTWGSATETGFLYATVADGVATTISGSPVAGGSYLLEGNATPVITLQLGENVAFDTALGYTLTTNSIAAAESLELQVTPSGTKTTFTAVEPAISSIDLNPEGESDPFATQAEAEAATNNVNIVASAEVETALGADSSALTDYLDNFEAKVVEDNGSYYVTVGLTAAAEATLQAQADADTAGVLDGIGGTATISATPGFYYSLEYGTAVNAISSESAKVLATGATVNLPDPLAGQNATSGFYKVKISVAP